MKNLLILVLLASLSISAFSYSTFNDLPDKRAGKIAAKLVFPVSGQKSNIGSFWGASRVGHRKHKGIDIFARKGTPVIAICDGVITSMRTEKLGGKTIRLKAEGYTWTAYYAHLDKQNVYVGQYVKQGDVLGTVGNTGNAKHTPSHLHFGIYNWKGAVNPLPYVKNCKKITLSKEAIENCMVKKSYKKNSETGTAVVYKYPAEKNNKYRTAFTESSKPAVSSSPDIWKTIDVPFDQKGSYYITSQWDVIRVYNKNTQVVGKLKETGDYNYPHSIALYKSITLYVNRVGNVVTQEGEEIGRVK